MSCKCYNVAFKSRVVVAAERKSKETAAQEFKVGIHVQRIRECCSQKKKLTMLKNSGRTRSPSVFIDVQVSLQT